MAMKPTYYSDYLKYKRLYEVAQFEITQLKAQLQKDQKNDAQTT